MPFFEFCVKCRQSFNNEAKWKEHISAHQQAGKKSKPADKKYSPLNNKAVTTTSEVPGADIADAEDSRLNATKELREMKKNLKAAGIECATMTAAETQLAYEQAKKEGLID